MAQFVLNIAVLAFLTLGMGCWQSHRSMPLCGKYKLLALDSGKQWGLYYSLEDGNAIGRIDESVVSVGWDQNIIIAKQYPKGDSSVTNYFILEINKDSDYAELSRSITGPMTHDQFKEMSAKLNISSNLAFSLDLDR